MSGRDAQAKEGLSGCGPIPEGSVPDEPVFAEPWEAQAFAMVVHLHARGVFMWEEWAACLSAEIHGGQARPYYGHWLRALERIVADKGLAGPGDLAARKDAWQQAAARTPHGQPIELGGSARDGG